MLEAMFQGAEASRHAKDPQHPDRPGTIAQFAAHVADIDPLRFFAILTKFVEPPPPQD